MENNKTCHLYTYIFLLVLSFFLFSYNVNADTVNVYLNNSNFNPFNSLNNIETIKNNVDTFISSNNLTNRYAIIYYGNINKYYLIIFNSLYDNNREYSYYRTNGLYITYSQELCYNIASDFSVSNSYTCDYTNQYVYHDYNSNSLLFLLYSNFNFTPNSSLSNVSTITYNYDTYNYTADTSHLLTLSELSDIWFPSDDTPILTSFYTLVIDKFSTIADFFFDNTYLFAIPLIPIFVLCIYLIKRSLIK